MNNIETKFYIIIYGIISLYILVGLFHFLKKMKIRSINKDYYDRKINEISSRIRYLNSKYTNKIIYGKWNHERYYIFIDNKINNKTEEKSRGFDIGPKYYQISNNENDRDSKKKEFYSLILFLDQLAGDDFSEKFSDEKKSNSQDKDELYNPYDILGIERDATDEQIKGVWRSLAKIYHPDKGNSPKKDKFDQYQKAYEKIQKERNFRN